MRESANDEVTVVGAGVTLEEAIKAHDTLKDEGIGIKVVDPFTIKPIDKNLLIKCARTTGGRILTVEDHHPEGMWVGVLFRMLPSEAQRRLELPHQGMLKFHIMGVVLALYLGQSSKRGIQDLY